MHTELVYWGATLSHASGNAGKKESGTECRHPGYCKNQVTSSRQFLFFSWGFVDFCISTFKEKFSMSKRSQTLFKFLKQPELKSARFLTDEKDSESEEAGKTTGSQS